MNTTIDLMRTRCHLINVDVDTVTVIVISYHRTLVLKHFSTNFALKTALQKCQRLTIQMPISNVLTYVASYVNILSARQD